MENKRNVKNTERIVILIDEELKKAFKLALIFDNSTMTRKIEELIRDYTLKKMEDIKNFKV